MARREKTDRRWGEEKGWAACPNRDCRKIKKARDGRLKRDQADERGRREARGSEVWTVVV
jgi:hypothetical protein